MVKLAEAYSRDTAVGASSKRILYLDYAKGLGIFWVVLGHSFGGLFAPDSEPSAILWRVFYYIIQWIYTFHMPLFFFISGLFLEKLAKKPLSRFLDSRLRGVVYPYVVWSVLQEVLRTIAGIRHKPLDQLWEILYSPLMQFWFLYVLLIVSVTAVVLRKLHLSVEAIFVLSALLLASILVDFNLGPWSVLYMVRVYSLYFVAGAICEKYNGLERLAQLESPVLLRGAIAAFALVTLAVILKISTLPVLTVLWATSGILATLLLAIYLERTSRTRFLQTWGARSLEIYLTHTIFSAVAATAIHRLMGPTYLELEVIVSVIAGIAGPLLFYRLCQRWQTMFLFRL